MTAKGFWTVGFQTTQGGSGSGVAMMQDGQVFGGDGFYTYTGTYSESDAGVNAQLKIKRFNPFGTSVFGDLKEFPLGLQGKLNGENKITGTATTPIIPGVTMKFEMIRQQTI